MTTIASTVEPIIVDGSQVFSLEDFMAHPPDNTEWVDGKLVEKTGMAFKHSVVQSRLDYYWRNYMISSGQGGEVLTEAPCRTNKQVCRPDVAYITPELIEQAGEFTVLPQSFPLIGEVASPDDSAEMLFAKAIEYIQSGCREVWLLFPEGQLVLVRTQQQWRLFTMGNLIETQTVLQGFRVAVDELLA